MVKAAGWSGFGVRSEHGLEERRQACGEVGLKGDVWFAVATSLYHPEQGGATLESI